MVLHPSNTGLDSAERRGLRFNVLIREDAYIVHTILNLVDNNSSFSVYRIRRFKVNLKVGYIGMFYVVQLKCSSCLMDYYRETYYCPLQERGRTTRLLDPSVIT